MKIAICDDCQNDIEYLKRIILECGICPEKVEFYEFYTGELLLSDITDFDLMFLDIKLEGVGGTRTAELIRLQNPLVPIVFYTGYDVMATEVIKVHPLNYLKKGNDINEHRQIINDIFKELSEQKKLPNLIIEYHGKKLVLHLFDILFISILDKGTEICITDEKRREIFGKREKVKNKSIRSGIKLEDYYEQLKNYGFIYAKKSYKKLSKSVQT